MMKSILTLMSLSLSFMAFADEGMWTLDNFPADVVADKYGVDIGDDWLRETRLATTDITGGNSGSPIIAADGTLAGLAFDGNIHSIAGDYWFDSSVNRTVGVNIAIILEALRTVYGADHLVRELSLVD
jgi:hypothetical protein